MSKTNVTYLQEQRIVSIIPDDGWWVYMKGARLPEKLIGWALVQTGARTIVTGLVCLNEKEIVTCDKLKSFDCYFQEQPAPRYF